MVYTKYITCSTLTHFFFSGFRGPLRDSAGPPPSISIDIDHSQPEPNEDKFDSRQDQAASEAAIAHFLKRLEVQGKRRRGYRDLESGRSSVPPARFEKGGQDGTFCHCSYESRYAVALGGRGDASLHPV